MKRLCKEDRRELVWAMRKSLLEQVDTSVLTESKNVSAKNFIHNEATYEQLMNLCFNENREEKYLSAAVLEGVAVKVYETYVKEAGEFLKSKGPLAKKVAADAKKGKGKKVVAAVVDTSKKAGTKIADVSKQGVTKIADVSKQGATKIADVSKEVPGQVKRMWGKLPTKAKVAVGAAGALGVGGTVASKLYKKNKAAKTA